jgi:hypothetical protein
MLLVSITVRPEKEWDFRNLRRRTTACLGFGTY